MEEAPVAQPVVSVDPADRLGSVEALQEAAHWDSCLVAVVQAHKMEARRTLAAVHHKVDRRVPNVMGKEVVVADAANAKNEVDSEAEDADQVVANLEAASS